MERKARSQGTLGLEVCWLILYVNLTRLRDALVTGKTLLLGVSVKEFPRD